MIDPPARLSAALADRYRIESELGQGGMATVYLAEDLKHDRKVAVKVLRPELAAVLGAERFVQEIKTTAALQHPHILPLFDSGEAGGFLYYVMPYIEGETLRDKLNRETQLGIEEAVKITTEVADALDYAHRNNVIHRDIKPENILLHDGRPMVADFGIALAVSAAAGGRMTETGLSLGTPHYMSPEQATAAKEITARSDIYSLGSVLYEMVAGEPPHTGGSAQAIIMKIVTDDARPVIDLRKSVPPNVAAATAKALEKLPADRFESAATFSTALTDERFMAEATTVSVPADVGSGAAGPVSLRKGWRWAVSALVLGGIAGWILKPSPDDGPVPVTRFTVPVPSGHELLGFRSNVALSGDGRSLAYFADGWLYRRDLAQSEPQALLQAPGGCCPMFTPDGRWILYEGLGAGGPRNAIAADGGSPVAVSSIPTPYDLVLSNWETGGIDRRRAGDTTWVPITALDPEGSEGAHLMPQLLEEGRAVLFTRMGPGMMWTGASVVIQDLEDGTRTTVATEATQGVYIPTGHVVYMRADGTVEAVPFDLRARRTTGAPFAVAEGVRNAYWGGAASFAVSEAGAFAFVRGSSWENHLLTWVDRKGDFISQVGPPVTVEGIRLSPDGRYAITYVASANADIARFDVATGEQRRLTFDPTTEDNPVWSPDGQRVAYRKIVSGVEHTIFVQALDGRSDAEPVYSSTSFTNPRAWSPDEAALVVAQVQGLLIINLESHRVDTVTAFRSGDGAASFSPEGHWLAYDSHETGRAEVYVMSYPSLSARQQVSLQGGRIPVWARESGELFFIKHDTLMVSSVVAGASFERTTPRPLFVSPDLTTIVGRFSVSADGQRILYPARNPDAPAREIHVVLNWFEELRGTARNE